VKRSCQHPAGAAGETMPRDEGWRFLMLGWMLERAEMTCRLLDVRYSQLVSGIRRHSAVPAGHALGMQAQQQQQ